MTIYDVFSLFDSTEKPNIFGDVMPNTQLNLWADYGTLAVMTGVALCVGVLAIRTVIYMISSGDREWRRTEHIVPRADMDYGVRRLTAPLRQLGWRK